MTALGPWEPIFRRKLKYGTQARPGVIVGDTPSVYIDEFCDDFSVGTEVAWDADYLRGDWALKDLGGAGSTFTVSGNIASYNNINPLKEIKNAATEGPRAWARATNRGAEFTSGGDRQVRLLINVGLAGEGTGAGTGSYYWGSFGRSGGVPTVALGKWWRGTDNTLASTPLTVGLEDVVMVRHDGKGGLYLDVNGVEVLAAQDNLVSSTGVWLRALGAGLGGASSIASEVVAVSEFCAGTWGDPEVPSPWHIADHLDTNTLGTLWTAEDAGGTAVNRVITTPPAAYFTTPDNNDHIRLTDASQLSADQFVEASYFHQTSSVVEVLVYLRSSSTSSGYYFQLFRVNSFPNDFFYGRIGLVSTGAALATQASPFFTGIQVPPGRIRCEAEGTALRLYWDGVLLISATDSSISEAGTIRFNPRGNGGQGIPQLGSIVVGNL